MLSYFEARGRVLGLAAPLEGIEIGLSEAVGLVLAEPLWGDVDLPPSDRAAIDGHAVRAVDTRPGAGLREVGPSTTAELTIEWGEAAWVGAGTPLPVGADAVLPPGHLRAEPGPGGVLGPRILRVERGVGPGHGVVPRGERLRAGAALAPAGDRVRTAMVGLLASQGCVHPVCHRRVRVAVLAVGEHLVGPADAPVMYRERNAAGLAIVAPCLRWGATAHDLGAVGLADLPAALARALTAPVALIVGGPDDAIGRALERAGVEPVFRGVALEPGGGLAYGTVRDGAGVPAHHVFHVGPGAVGVMAAVALVVGPLVARLQGGPADAPPSVRAVWSDVDPGSKPALDTRATRAVPVSLRLDDQARLRARPVALRDPDDLPALARADALALLPAGGGPWHEGEVVEVVPLGGLPWAA